jgi:hypothetical protein
MRDAKRVKLRSSARILRRKAVSSLRVSVAAFNGVSEEAGALRAIDALRDDEQHWYHEVDEGILYVHARAAITLFDDLLQRVFDEHLADHLPLRVLPLSTEAPWCLELSLGVLRTANCWRPSIMRACSSGRSTRIERLPKLARQSDSRHPLQGATRNATLDIACPDGMRHNKGFSPLGATRGRQIG